MHIYSAYILNISHKLKKNKNYLYFEYLFFLTFRIIDNIAYYDQNNAIHSKSILKQPQINP